MTIAWPGTVNQNVQQEGYAETPDTNIASFAPEIGPPKTRQRMSMSTDKLSAVLLLTATEYANFLTFFRTTLSDGTQPFTFTHPRTKSTVTFRFVGAPKMQAIGPDTYSLSMTLQTLP